MPLRPHSLIAVAIVVSVLLTPAIAGAAPLGECQISGTEGDDVLIGTEGDDVICGLGGDDLLIGAGGSDRLIGGDGADKLHGGPGADVLFGDAGSDLLFGGSGADVLRGGSGADRLIGGAGEDVLRGGNGDDDLAGGEGADTLWGGNDDDLLRGANGDDVLYGGVGDDLVRGGSGSDRLRGGPDEDVCIDSSVRTNARTCEFGVGGDLDRVAIERATWRLRGNDEFVYSVSSHAPCSDDTHCRDESLVDIVHVSGGQATSAFGSLAHSSSQLFDLASEAILTGREVAFDRATGFPLRIGGADDERLVVHEISLRDDIRESLRIAVRNWSERAEGDYSYIATPSCACPETGPIEVVVKNDRAIATALDGSPIEWPGFVKTIDDHLVDIGELLDGHAIEVDAEFKPSTGLLVSYTVDRDRQLRGDEFAIVISDFSAHVPPAADEHPADDVPETLRIVDVGGIEVSSVIAEEVQSLLDAAVDAGFRLSGGGFRDPQRQIDLRRINCGTTDYAIFEMPADQCSPPTARPGSSQHELGLAIDFTSGGRLITSSSDPAFVWLVENASLFGFINLAAEPWHWSTTGN